MQLFNMKEIIFLILMYGTNIQSLEFNEKVDKDDGKSSLAFVFDTTGSMSNDLKQLREGAEMILKTALEESKIIADFVFVPFHDPNIGPATITKSKEVFKNALNIIHVKGGGDCPEKSLGGVLLALSVSRPRSYVYVFTDASASDYKIVGKVLDAVQRKQSQVVFVLTGHCNDVKRQTYKVYQQVATASSGQVFNLNKTNVHNVLDFVRSSIRGRSVNLVSAVHPAGYNYTQAIPVDSSLGEVTVSVSGAKPTIKVVNPSGHEVVGPPQLVTTLDLSEIMIVKVLEPEPGNWTITVGSEKDYSVKVSGLSNLTFDHGFSVEKTNSMDESSYRPLQGTYNHMLLSVTPDVPIQINFAEILTTDGKTLFEVPVKKTDNNMFLADAFIPPDDFFYIAINGRDQNGQEFRRVGPTAVQAKQPDVPYLTAPKQLEARSHDRVVLKCIVESLVPVTVQWTRDSPRMQRKTSSLQGTSIEYVIEDMSEAHVGSYRCSASNAAGHSKVNTQLSLLVEPPQVSVLPVNATLSTGEDLTISCAVFSEAVLLKSQIIFNDGNTKNVTNVKVGLNNDGFYSYNKTISNVTEGHHGMYTCLAANKGGSTSQSTYITIESEPKAKILGPHNVAGQFNTNIQLLCQVDNANLAQWLSPNNTVAREMSINGTYNISVDVTVTEDGDWTCVALRNSHKASDTVQVNIQIKPKVFIEGKNITIVQGSIQQLVCTVHAKPPPTILWKRGTEYINNTIVQVNETVYRSVMTLDSDRDNVNGTYFCIGENSIGTAQDNIIVNIRKKMQLLENFTDQQVELYSQIDFHCNVDTYPPATITWQHNNTDIITDDNTDISDDGTTLYIQKIDFKDLGLYTCVMDNGYERIQINGTLEVVGLESPVLSKEPSRITARRGDTALISCRLLKGNPEPKITWQYRTNGTEFKHLENNAKINEEGFIVTINNTSLKDEAIYQCIAENAVGNDNYEVFLNIQYPPELKILQLAQNGLEIKSGEKVVLNCDTVGNPPPIVVWTKESKPVSYSKNVYLSNENALVIENVTVYDSGTYSCNASNTLGAVVSNYTIQVYMLPIITTPPPEIPIQVLEGQLVELPCTVSGTPTPTVIWVHNNVTEHRKYIDEYGLRFVANLTDFGDYSCIATNPYGKAVLNYSVYVWVAPYLEPPLLETKNIKLGSNVTLQCSAIGFPLPVIFWQHNDNLLIENTTDFSFNEIGQLNITDASSKHEGRYECIAENLAGFAVKTITLNVNEAPKIIEDNYTGPYVATVLDSSLAVTCRAAGKPTPYIVWIKDGYYLDKDSRYDIDIEGTLTIKSPSEELSGDYTCLAKNSLGNSTRTVSVQIFSVPGVMMSEESQSVVHVVEGTNATIDCPLRLGLNDTLKWYKDAILISNGTLNLSPVRRADGATYACVVNNMAGGAHATLTVDVQWPPHVHTDSLIMDVVRGDDVILNCDVDAKPTARIKWLFNSKLLLGEDKNDFKLKNIQVRQTGVYKCVASNEHGTAVKQFTVDVLVPPFISDFDVLDVQLKEGTNATLECNARGSPKPDIKWTFNNTSWLVHKTTLISTNITINSEGIYKCEATNKAGTTSLTYRVNVVKVAKIEDIVAFNGTVGTNVIHKFEVVLDSYIRIACKSSGKPTPNIQWIRHGNTVSNNTANIRYADLIINKVATSDSGVYVCVASNEGGVDERKIKLDVLEPPKIFKNLFQEATSNIINLEILSGQAFYLHCHPYGNPLPEIYWFKNNIPLKLFDNSMIFTDYSEIIQSPNAKYEQTGNYTCVARNKVGETALVYLVDVLVPPPQPKESTKEVRTKIGKALNLTCPVEGAPKPYVMWIKHPYMEISDEIPRVHLSEDNVTLIINDTLVSDSGIYSCIMTNKVGSIEVNFNVIVEKPSSIVGNTGNDTLESHVVSLRRSIVLKCDVEGHPIPKITWLKDIQVVSDGEAHVQGVVGGSLLAVWNAETRHAGQYICVAENSAGTDSRRYNIAVKVPGKWSAWSKWSYCNVTCGLGYQMRSRFCHYIDDNNNTIDKTSSSDKIILDESGCKGSTVDKRKCHMPSCEEEEVVWSGWSRWGACSATCGAGTQARARRCRARHCAGDNVQIRKCPNLPKCQPQRHPNEVYSSQESKETNLSSYLPETIIEIQPDDDDFRKSLDPEEIYIPSGKKPQMYFDVNVTENLDRSERGPCDPGFTYNVTDHTCEDVDECIIDNNQCHATQVCSNTAGGYRCSCPRGYVALAAGLRCLDVNECEQGRHGCEFACVNVAGGYVCACPRHLRLHRDRHHCVPPPLYQEPLSFYENSFPDEYLEDKFQARYTKYNRY